MDAMTKQQILEAQGSEGAFSASLLVYKQSKSNDILHSKRRIHFGLPRTSAVAFPAD